MAISVEMLPIFQITLPILGGMFLSVLAIIWAQNKAFDAQNKRLDDIVAELREMRKVLTEQGERITRLEERIPPLVHHH